MPARGSRSIDTDTASAGWEARLELHYAPRGGRTRLVSKHQYGPLTLQRPFYPEGGPCHSYILHPPGGVAGNDSLQVQVDAQTGAHCLLTTPGATKFYRSADQCRATVSQQIRAGNDAVVEWLPQQNIFFPGANAAVSTVVEIAPGGKYLGWEINCLGRPANGEPFCRGAVRSTTRVYLDGELRLNEQLHIGSEQALHAATGMRGLPMQGSFIAAPCSEEHKSALEQILQSNPGHEYGHPVGLTLVDEVLVVRALGEQTEPLLRLLTLLWGTLRQMWLQKAPCPPRIWST